MEWEDRQRGGRGDGRPEAFAGVPLDVASRAGWVTWSPSGQSDHFLYLQRFSAVAIRKAIVPLRSAGSLGYDDDDVLDVAMRRKINISSRRLLVTGCASRWRHSCTSTSMNVHLNVVRMAACDRDVAWWELLQRFDDLYGAVVAVWFCRPGAFWDGVHRFDFSGIFCHVIFFFFQCPLSSHQVSEILVQHNILFFVRGFWHEFAYSSDISLLILVSSFKLMMTLILILKNYLSVLLIVK